MAKLLYVEDDHMMAENVREALALDGHNVEIAESGEDAAQLLSSFNYDLVLLDWDLPGMSGLDVCKLCRRKEITSWIVFLTGRVDTDSVEEGLNAGADDYLKKPFKLSELRARVRSALRRLAGSYRSELEIDGLQLDVANRCMILGEENVRLMPREVALLEFLMRNPNKHYSAVELLASVWPSESQSSTNSVRVCMSYLRQKLTKIGRPDFIETDLGIGYMVRR